MAVDGLDASIAAIRGLVGRGEYLAAHDACVALGDQAADTVRGSEVTYLQALALARSGATHQARHLIDALVATIPWEQQTHGLGEDIAALGARLVKDEAWRAGSPEGALALAARAYEDVHRRFGGSYTAVNAATLWLLAGDAERATGLAREALAALDRDHVRGEEATYWAWATRGEALVVLGDVAGAAAALEAAGGLAVSDLGTRASTRSQIRRLCVELGWDPIPLLAPLAPPEVLHYCGHMVSPVGAPGRFPWDQEEDVADAVRRRLADRAIGFVYGSLASGSDIIVAEAALERGAELHVVMPFALDEFLTVSVAPSGTRWVERFTSCLQASTSVTVASDSAYRGDDVLFAYAARIAMGNALNRAAAIDAEVWQLAVFDGDASWRPAGTSHDMDVWRHAGGTTETIPVAPRLAVPPETPSTVAPPGDADRRPSGHREIRAVLFGDFKGFSRLRDEHMEAFMDSLVKPLASVLDAFRSEIVVRNTWGDGLFVVLTDTVSGARCALDIQERLRSVDLSAIGLPPDMGMRLGAHTAPVMAVHDPVLDRPSVMGRELTRAARIEPRTPVGEVYVTASFAALLALEPTCGVTPEYVGHLTTAKDFETTAMYLLRR
jgi:hypothetical protein